MISLTLPTARRGSFIVISFALSVLITALFIKFPPKLIAPSGAVLGGGSESIKDRMSEVIEKLPGGAEFIRYLPKKTLAWTRSGDEKDKFVFATFQSNPPLMGNWSYITKG